MSNTNGGENLEKIHFDHPSTIRHRSVYYVVKNIRLVIVLCKIKKSNTLQDTSDVHGMVSEVS